MSSEPVDTDGAGRVQEFDVTTENTFGFLPGPLTGISCPYCFTDQLLKDVISQGECNSCGAHLNLKLEASAAPE